VTNFTKGKRFGLFHAGQNELDVDTTIGREWANLERGHRLPSHSWHFFPCIQCRYFLGEVE